MCHDPRAGAALVTAASVLLIVCALLTGCRAGPTQQEIDAALNQHADCRSLVVEHASIGEVGGSLATATASVRCTELVDDGTWGESCGNLLGCYVERERMKTCSLIFRWRSDRWLAQDVTCTRS